MRHRAFIAFVGAAFSFLAKGETMTQALPLYQALARRLIASRNCWEKVESGDNWQHWRDMAQMHESAIEKLCADHLPHGSGFDAGVKFNMEESRPDRLILAADFHHMDDNGFYCGWTEHRVIVRACLAFGFTLRITGVNRRGIKDYITDTFYSAMSAIVSE